MNLMHDFHESLAKSHAASDLPFWGVCYRQAFPLMIGMHDHREDGEHQRQGIDRSVVLDNGKIIWIDEKVRWKDYGDIALEYWSNEARRIPGWVCKPLLCDYIAYAIAPAGRCYLMPVVQLQTAWDKHGADWAREGREVRAQNNGYVTVSVAVDPKILFDKIINEMFVIEFDPIERIEP